MNQTIIERQAREKSTLLEQLKKIPIVQIACEKANVGRTTYYRWRKEDAKFKEAADTALLDGSTLVNDMAESQLLAAIRDRNMTAIIFWLKHHHSAYTTRIQLALEGKQNDELTQEQKEIVRKALALAALTNSNGTSSHESQH